MKKLHTQLVAAFIAVAVLAGSTLSSFAQEKKDKKDGPLPFNGKVAGVNKDANTLKVGNRVFNLTAESRITKAGKPATLADGAVGEEVAGSYKKVGEKLEIVSVRFGPRPEGESKGKGESKGNAKGKEKDDAK